MDIYVSNLPPVMSREDLKNLFNKYGEVSDVLCFKERGFAIVKMTNAVEAAKSINSLRGKQIGGVALKVTKASGLETKRQRSKTYISREWREKAEFKE